MLFKVMKKLKLAGAARAVLLPAARILSPSVLSMTAEEAEAILAAHSPDPGASACCAEARPSFPPEYDLDIIIPVYNVEKYLPECIQSVLSQETAYRFRAIFVDDGATDNSGKILDRYQDDPRVLVIHQKNKGFSGARNTGLNHSNSRYLMFLDSDDRLAPSAIDIMLSAALQTKASLVQGCFATFYDSEAPQRDMSLGKALLLNPPLSKLPGYAWSKVIRSEYLQHLRFPEGYWFEDSISAQILYPLIQRDGNAIVGIDDIVYYYRQNPAGISRQALKKKKSIDSFHITRALHRDRERFGLHNNQAYYEYILDNICLTYERTRYQPEDVRKALLILWNAFLTENFSGFHTTRKAYLPLEAAIRDQNFTQYSLCCRLL